MNNLGWYSRCVVMILDNGTVVYPSQDDEGNGAGSLFTNDYKNPVLPVIQMSVDYTGREDMEEVMEDLTEVFDEDEIVRLITELYFSLDTPARLDVKRNIS